MAKKRKDQNTSSTSCYQEANGSDDLQVNEEQNHSGVEKLTAGTSSQQNAPSMNHQFQSVVQWPVVSQSDQSQDQQQNFTIHHLQHGRPFWDRHRPCYALSPLGTGDVTWQGPAITSTGFPIRNQSPTPNFYHPFTYQHPGIPSPWDPSTWWGQLQQTQPHCMYTFPGVCGYFPSLPPAPVPGCSAPFLQRGTIEPPAKLSQKHQQLWEAQSAENVQLWSVVGQLQSELADYKKRITKLESDILSLKPTVEETAKSCSGTSITGQQISKRGRPKRPTATSDAVPRSQKLQKIKDEQTAEIIFTRSTTETGGIGPKNLADPKPVDTKNKVNGVASKSGSEVYEGMTSGGNGNNLTWPADMFTKDLARESFYTDDSVGGHGRKFVGGWSFGSEENVSVPRKDEDEEIDDDGSSGAENIAREKSSV